MGSDVDSGELADFLAAHKSVEFASPFAHGDLFGDWRVTAFLGRGGSGEVYRVVHSTLGTEAALKVCVRNAERDDIRDAAVCDRFRREAKLLADNAHPAFPRFLGFGERDGRPWYVMELLEHRPLPTGERSVARFLLAVASGVRHLHSLGLVHRDIKPANILWRRVRDSAPYQIGGNGRSSSTHAAARHFPVIIDLGLVKDTSAVRGHMGDSLSIVDGKAVGVGTPRYAAPEQLTGDEVSPATDVYALGMLANDCFDGKPPRTWGRIIQRATAAIPAQRYATASSFIRAVKLLRARTWIVGAIVVAATALAIAFLLFSAPLEVEPSINVADQPMVESRTERPSWQDLCRSFTTNIVTWHSKIQRRQLAPGEPPNPDDLKVVSWAETNAVKIAEAKLNGRTIVFDEPIDLGAGREYWIVGPGVLDARFSATSNAIVRIINCRFKNRTAISPENAGIHYVLDAGAYLNFMELPSTESMKLRLGARIRINGMSEGRRWWRIKGPEDLLELIDEDNKSPIYSATMESF